MLIVLMRGNRFFCYRLLVGVSVEDKYLFWGIAKGKKDCCFALKKYFCFLFYPVLRNLG
jgi:hypothetical protein